MFAGLLVWVFSRCEHSLVPPLRSYGPSNAEAWDKLLDPGLDKSSGISAFSPGLLLLVLWLVFFSFWRLEGNSDATLESCLHCDLSHCNHPVSRASPFPCYNRDVLANPSPSEPSSFEISVAFIQLPLCKNYVPQRKFLSGSHVVPWQLECFSLFK